MRESSVWWRAGDEVLEVVVDSDEPHGVNMAQWPCSRVCTGFEIGKYPSRRGHKIGKHGSEPPLLRHPLASKPKSTGSTQFFSSMKKARHSRLGWLRP